MTDGHARVLGLPALQQESYITREELARIMGVCVSTIDNMRRDGMPSTKWGRRTRRFLASEAIAWAQARDGRKDAAA
jgi:phage terminase Nu1 subunit (DNA packaging protein)